VVVRMKLNERSKQWFLPDEGDFYSWETWEEQVESGAMKGAEEGFMHGFMMDTDEEMDI